MVRRKNSIIAGNNTFHIIHFRQHIQKTTEGPARHWQTPCAIYLNLSSTVAVMRFLNGCQEIVSDLYSGMTCMTASAV